jgi:hypothetical protein
VIERVGRVRGDDELGERQRVDIFARRLARIGRHAGLRAARRSRHQVEFEARQPHRRAEVRDQRRLGVMTAGRVLREVDDALPPEQRHGRDLRRGLRLLDESRRLRVDARIAERAGRRLIGEQRSRDDKIDVEIARGFLWDLFREQRQRAVHRAEQRGELRRERAQLELLDQAVVRCVDRVQDAVDRDEHRQLGLIDVVIRPAVARLFEAIRDDEAGLAERRLFARGEPVSPRDQVEPRRPCLVIPRGASRARRRGGQRADRGSGQIESATLHAFSASSISFEPKPM